MERYIIPALIANASTLGIHWIYDHTYIEQLHQKQSVLFLIQDKRHYENASPSYYSYPGHVLGDVTVQGRILTWLYQAMNTNNDLSQLEYSKLLYHQFKPGGTYTGYVESYAKQHVIRILARSLELYLPEMEIMDDHLVGFMPYLVCKELGLDTKKAWELTQVYSQDEDYYTYFKMFDRLFELLPNVGLHKAIEQVIASGPNKFQVPLHKALEIDDPNRFIRDYSGRACAIKYSIPLILHILYHTDSYQEAVEYNALLGGAISDRNMILGAIMAQTSKIPKQWREKVIHQIKL